RRSSASVRTRPSGTSSARGAGTPGGGCGARIATWRRTSRRSRRSVGTPSKLDPLGPVEASEAAPGAERPDFRARVGRALFGQSCLSGVLRSFLTLAAGEWVARLIGIAIQIWLARQLTPGPYGVITFGIALIGWFGLVVDSGTEQLNVREI